jgi:WD40-like Beta Propeller Repeat
MRTNSNSTLPQRLLIGVLIGLAVCITLVGTVLLKSSQPAQISNIPSQDMAQVPPPAGTGVPTIISGETPTESIPSTTPTHVTLQAATLVTPTTTSDLALDANTSLVEKNAINGSEALHSLTFAPTGDKLIYATISGNLYWSNLDGTNATLVHSYDPGANYRSLDDQMPKGNTLFVPGYAMQFTAGQAPIITDAPATLGVYQIRWWSATRASGMAGGSSRGGYVGGDQLVTLDTNGGLVSSLNIPYMGSGAVQPGGTWLAYATSQQATDTPFEGSAPQTIYMLNLSTGQRLQLTQPGMGWEVFSWSPDGNWIYASAIVDNALRGVLISADGLQWVIVAPPGHSGYDAVWSPDSKHLAFSVQDDGCGDGDITPCPPSTSQVYIVNVPERKKAPVDNGPGSFTTGTEQMMRPKWSPDGILLALLSFDPDCEPQSCTGTVPALYLMSAPSK